MRTALLLGLVALSIAAYFLLSAAFGIYQAVPWAHLVIAVAATIALVVTTVRGFGKARLAATLVAVLMTSAYAWYVFDYSSYHGVAADLEVGQAFDDLAALELPNQRGESIAVLADAATTRATLLVFYRGFW